MKSIFAIPLLFLLLASTANAAPDEIYTKLVQNLLPLKGLKQTVSKLPANVHLMRTTNLKASGLVSKRYQQLVGNAGSSGWGN